MKPRRIEDIQTRQQPSGIVTGMPRIRYDNIRHLNPSSIASGLVDHMEVDPAAIKYAFESPNKTTQQASLDRMDRGTLAHLMLLQPERVAKDVAIWTGGTRKGAEWDNFETLNVGKFIIRDQDYEAVSEAVTAFRLQPKLTALLTDLDAEVAMFSTEHSFHVKGLVDAVTRGPVCRIIDLKTTEAGISFKSVERTIRDFNNREKMAAYKRWYERESGNEIIGCYNVFLSMVKPYAFRIEKMTTMAMEWGDRRIQTALDEVQRCLDANSWPMFVREDEVLVQEWEMNSEIEVPE